MDEQQSDNSSIASIDCVPVEVPSIASLFHEACRELAQSDARIYRSVGQHIAKTKEILRQAEAVSHSPQLAEIPTESLAAVAPTYDRQTRKSLENHCRLHGISGYSRLSKSKMVSLLQCSKIPPPPVPMEALTKAELIELLRQAIYQRNNNAQQ
jgi:hypothetical protein